MSTGRNSIERCCYGNNVRLVSDNDQFLRFANAYLSKFDVADAEDDAPVKIRSKIIWNEKPSVDHEIKIGRCAFIKNNSLYYNDNKFDLIATINENLEVKIYPKQEQTSVRGMVRSFLNDNSTPLSHSYQLYLRNAFHFPLFYLLEKQDFRFFHGSAIKILDDIFIFPGSAEIGKSIANVCLNTLQSNASIISDNYLLFKGNNIYCFPEPTRWESDFNASIPENYEYLFNVKGRGYYTKANMTSNDYPLNGENTHVVFLQRGIKEDIEKIDLKMAKKIMRAMTHFHSSEFHNKSWTAFLSYLDREPDEMSVDEFLPDDLSIHSYIFTVPRFDTFSNAIETYQRMVNYVRN